MAPTVPITPMRPVCVTIATERTPGSMTPTTGTPNVSSSSPNGAAAAAVLHATTSSFTRWSSTRWRPISKANPRTWPSGRGPYG